MGMSACETSLFPNGNIAVARSSSSTRRRGLLPRRRGRATPRSASPAPRRTPPWPSPSRAPTWTTGFAGVANGPAIKIYGPGSSKIPLRVAGLVRVIGDRLVPDANGYGAVTTSDKIKGVVGDRPAGGRRPTRSSPWTCMCSTPASDRHRGYRGSPEMVARLPPDGAAQRDPADRHEAGHRLHPRPRQVAVDGVHPAHRPRRPATPRTATACTRYPVIEPDEPLRLVNYGEFAWGWDDQRPAGELFKPRVRWDSPARRSGTASASRSASGRRGVDERRQDQPAVSSTSMLRLSQAQLLRASQAVDNVRNATFPSYNTPPCKP
jgi:hypothetical protein